MSVMKGKKAAVFGAALSQFEGGDIGKLGKSFFISSSSVCLQGQT